MRVRLMIDPDGMRRAESSILREWQAHGSFSGNELVRYLVQNLGYVLCDYAANRLTVALSTRSLGEVTATELLFIFADHEWDEDGIITVAESGRLVHVFRQRDRAIQWLIELLGTIPKSRHSRFTRRRLDDGAGDSAASFRELKRISLEAKSSDVSGSLGLVLARAFGDCFLILEADRDAGLMRIMHAGAGYPGLTENWRQRVLDRPLGDFDDKSYGLFVSDAYRDAVRNEGPTLERIEGTTRYPGAAPVHMVYDRLIAPLASDSSSRFYVSATIYRSRTVLAR